MRRNYGFYVSESLHRFLLKHIKILHGATKLGRSDVKNLLQTLLQEDLSSGAKIDLGCADTLDKISSLIQNKNDILSQLKPAGNSKRLT